MNRSVKKAEVLRNSSLNETANETDAEEVRARLRSMGSRHRMPLNRLIDRAASHTREDESTSDVLTLEVLRARLAA
jgi:hypothetical protein